MNIRLIVITSDIDYVECFSDVIEDSYKGVFKMSICSSAEKYKELSEKKSYDIALVDEALTDEMVFPRQDCVRSCAMGKQEHKKDLNIIQFKNIREFHILYRNY